MRMKEDAMMNGQTKPGYNLQIGTENQFILDFGLFQTPGDPLTMIPFLKSCHERYDRLPSTVVADSGYGSEENYHFMDRAGIEAYVKYNRFHIEQRMHYEPDPFSQQALYYNADEDYYVCPMGQHMQRIGTSRERTESGYVAEKARYRAQRCDGCPLRCRCFRSKGNRIIEVNHRLAKYRKQAAERLTSEEGIKYRGEKMHRARGRLRTDEVRHELQTLQALRYGQGQDGLCLLCNCFQHKENVLENQQKRQGKAF